MGALVGVQVSGHPWMMGEYWPMITPCFRLRAVDDAGDEHEGMPGGWQGFPGNEGHGSFFWPPVDPTGNSIRVTVNTPWQRPGPRSSRRDDKLSMADIDEAAVRWWRTRGVTEAARSSRGRCVSAVSSGQRLPFTGAWPRPPCGSRAIRARADVGGVDVEGRCGWRPL